MPDENPARRQRKDTPEDLVWRILTNVSNEDPSKKAVHLIKEDAMNAICRCVRDVRRDALTSTIDTIYDFVAQCTTDERRNVFFPGYVGMVLSCVVSENVLQSFKLHLTDDKTVFPFVHYGDSKTGKAALERLKSPFGNFPFTNITASRLVVGQKNITRVLYGESGIGKTHLAMFSNERGLLVYLLFDEDFGYEHPHLGSSENQFPFVDQRDLDRFTDTIVDCCARAFTDGIKDDQAHNFDSIANKMKNVHVRIVADELGQKPNMIRLFIKQQDDIRDKLEKRFFRPGDKFRWPGCKSIDVVLVGTGINLNLNQVADTTAYELVKVSDAKTAFFVNVANELSHNANMPWQLAREDLGDPALVSIRELIQNRRAAVLAASQLVQITKSLRVRKNEEMVRVLRQAAGTVVYQVALDFKSLNALEDLDPEGLRWAALNAFNLSMPQVKRPVASADQLKWLVTCFGLLVDVSGEHSVRDLHMSPSMRLMMLAMLGFGDVATLTGRSDGIERLVALKCVLAMMTTNNTDELHSMLHSDPIRGTNTALGGNAGGNMLLRQSDMQRTKPLMPGKNGVVLMKLEHPLSGGNDGFIDTLDPSVIDTLQQIASHVRSGGCAVVLNAPDAPYADVIAIRDGYLGFFQVKDEDGFSGQDEAAKLTTGASAKITTTLCRIANAPLDNAGLVVVSPGSSPAGPSFCVPDGREFLFPFCWPAEQRSARHLAGFSPQFKL